jgi:CrcB protein
VSLHVFFAVCLLGGIGSVLRFLLDGGLSARVEGPFPAGTLAVNLSGSLLLGVLVGAGLSGDGLHLLAIGLIGGFTTFSTWMFESQRLTESGLGRTAAVNVAASLLLGFAAVWLGLELGGLL